MPKQNKQNQSHPKLKAPIIPSLEGIHLKPIIFPLFLIYPVENIEPTDPINIIGKAIVDIDVYLLDSLDL